MISDLGRHDENVFQAKRVFLSAEWRDLVMLNYEVEPGLLKRLRSARYDSWIRTRDELMSASWVFGSATQNARTYPSSVSRQFR